MGKATLRRACPCGAGTHPDSDPSHANMRTAVSAAQRSSARSRSAPSSTRRTSARPWRRGFQRWTRSARPGKHIRAPSARPPGGWRDVSGQNFLERLLDSSALAWPAIRRRLAEPVCPPRRSPRFSTASSSPSPTRPWSAARHPRTWLACPARQPHPPVPCQPDPPLCPRLLTRPCVPYLHLCEPGLHRAGHHDHGAHDQLCLFPRPWARPPVPAREPGARARAHAARHPLRLPGLRPAGTSSDAPPPFVPAHARPCPLMHRIRWIAQTGPLRSAVRRLSSLTAAQTATHANARHCTGMGFVCTTLLQREKSTIAPLARSQKHTHSSVAEKGTIESVTDSPRAAAQSVSPPPSTHVRITATGVTTHVDKCWSGSWCAT